MDEFEIRAVNGDGEDKLPTSTEAHASDAHSNSKRRRNRKRKRRRREREGEVQNLPGGMTTGTSAEIAIQDFKGDGDGTLSGIKGAMEFCNTIDAAKGLSGWSDEVAAYVAKYHTKGAALTWLTNLGDERSKRWPALKAALLKRYGALSMPERTRVIQSLGTLMQEAGNETVSGFMDRVRFTVRAVMKEDRERVEEEERRTGFDMGIEAMERILLFKGLSDDEERNRIMRTWYSVGELDLS